MENEDCLLSLDERHSLWATHWERLPHCWFAFQTSGRELERITETLQGTREHTRPHARRRHNCRNTLKNRPHHRGVGSIRTCDRTRSIPSLFLIIIITPEDCDFGRIRFSQRWRQFTNGEHLTGDTFCIAETYTKTTQIVYSTQTCWHVGYQRAQ